MSVGSATSNSASQSKTTTVSKDTTGFNGLTADDFFKLLIQQLKSQDPTQPMTNDQLLTQLSTMRGLQADVEMGTTLKDLASSLKTQGQDAGQKLSVGSSFIGQSVTFANNSTGVVTDATLQDGEVLLTAAGRQMKLSDVKSVNSPEGFVGRTVSGVGKDNDDKIKPLFGYVSRILKQDGQDMLEISGPDPDGKPEVIGQIPFNQVVNAYSYESMIGKQVRAVTSNGDVISGILAPTKQGSADTAHFTIGNDTLPIQNILNVTAVAKSDS